MPDGDAWRRGFATLRYFLAAWGLLVFYRSALTLAPYRWVSRALPAAPKEKPAPDWAKARTRWAVSAAARAVPGATCLPQAMTGHALLSIQGYASIIRIGVRGTGAGVGQMKAHAWVLSGDSVVVGDDGENLGGFSRLTDLEGIR